LRFLARRRAGVSSIVGSIFFVLIMVVAIGSLVTMFNSFTAYNQQVTGASNSNQQAAETQLSVTSGQFGEDPPSTTNAATACSTTATDYTITQKTFYAADMWWDFYTCNGAFQYSTSFDGVTWSAETSIPSVITTGYTVGPYFDVEVVGTTMYLAIAEKGADAFQFGNGTLLEGGTDGAPDGTISWNTAPANVVTTAAAFGPITMGVDSAGNQWIAVVQGACTAANCGVGVYEHEACAAASNQGWEPNACGSATAPTNYSPTGAALNVDAQVIVEPAISTYSTTGAIMLYETGSNTNPSAGVLHLVTQTALASAAWNTITLTGINDYSLQSSSALMIGGTFYFAGLTGALGAATGTLDFWTLPFTSMTAGTPSTAVQIEGTTEAWEAALTSSGSTLALFDSYPTDTAINYYTSSTLGSIWSSPAINLESGETSVGGLSPAQGAFAVTWFNSADNVRFAALSTFTLSNSSPFAVHVVDVYVYDPSTNTLVAHWYYNSTEQFDYWIGQGSNMSLPITFDWTASTSYLVTFSTDAGVTAQGTFTTLPGTAVSCPAGEFYSELSPLDECTSTSSTNPVMEGGSGTETCSDSVATAEMMGLDLAYTTSAYSSGSLYISFTFQVTSPATTSINSVWQLYYGSGTGPTCGTASTGTALGEPYTVRSQAAFAKGVSQAVSVTLTGLTPSTTYWFDVRATDSSAATWIYSNPHLAITDLVSTNSPDLATSANTNTCPITSATAGMAGLGTTFTTGGTGFTGTVFGELAFNIAQTAVGATNTAYVVHYGTGAAPGCHVAAAGTAASETYTFTSQSAAAGALGGVGQKVGFVLTGLTASTTYWVDVEETDSSGVGWTYSNPTLSVMLMPTAGTNSLPNAVLADSTNTCSDATAGTAFPGYDQMGFGLHYDVPSSAQGNLFITLTFQLAIPGTAAGVSTTWQASYGTGVSPACNTAETGLTFGNSYTVTSQSATVAGAMSVSETLILSNIQSVAGTTIWIDVQAYDSSGATWTYSNPAIAVAMFPS
jgi:hypothetical protein